MEFDLDFLIVANNSKYVIYDVGKMTNLRLTESVMKNISFQVLKAVYYLHVHILSPNFWQSADIVHRNIKPSSILVDESANVMLSSFSKSIALRCSKPPLIPLANRYSPPEYCHLSDTKSPSPEFWKACDMWGVGLLLGCMIKGAYVFESTKKNDLLAEVHFY
jgi:serine/threonine protein kinase